MPKLKRVERDISRSTLKLIVSRVFLAVASSCFATPVFFYTRTRARSARLRVMVVTAILLIGFATALAVTVSQPAQTAATTANTVNFQARLMTASGAIVPDGSYNVEFKLYNASASAGSSQGSCTGDANCLWTETRTSGNTVSVANGYLTVNLGSVTNFPSSLNWGQQLWLTMRIGGTGAPSWDSEMSPRLLLTAVPAAYSLTQYNTGNTFSSSLTLQAPTGGNQSFVIQDQTAAGTYNICIQNTTACGFAPSSGSANYIQNQNSGAQSTSNFWISGTGTMNLVQAATLDTPSGTTTLNIGTNNATAGINLNQNTAIASGKSLTVTNGSVFFQKGADYSTTGVANNVNFGAGALFRLTGASAQTITGIAGGADGRKLVLVNAAAQSATISNNNTNSTAGNRITTGTGADLTLASGASISLVYDSGASLWRVVGGSGGGSGVTTVGAFSGVSIANGASISGSTITFGPADGTNPGMVSTGSQTFAGNKTFTGTLTVSPAASTTALVVTNSNGNALVFDSTTNTFKVFENVASPTNYASISYASGAAKFAANSGTTQIGSGTGNVTSNLTGQNDTFQFSKTYSPTAAYSLQDYQITRTLSSGANAQSGAVLKVTDSSTANAGVSIAPTLLLLNQASTTGTIAGNLIDAQLAGVSKFSVSTAGNVTYAGSLTGGSAGQFTVANTGLLSVITSTGGPIAYVKELGSGYGNANAAIVADTDNPTGTANYLYQGRLAGTNVFSVRADGLITGVGVNAGTGAIQGTGGLAITGNSTIAGTLGSLTGLTSSGTITFSGLNTAGIVTNTAAGVLGTVSSVPVANGGTGQSSYTIGDILYASAATTLSKLSDAATGNVLISGGAGVAPSWGKVGLTTHVSGVLPIANGGTNLSTTPTNGQLLIGNGAGYTLGTLSGTGITVTNGAGTIGLATVYGSGANTAVQGNTTVVCPAGSGNLTNAGNTITLGSGGTCNSITMTATPTFSSTTVQGGGADISLTGAASNYITWNGNGVGAPTFTTSSAGTKLLLYPQESASSVDYAMGIAGSTLWSAVPQATGSYQFSWYGGTTVAATLTGNGNFTTAGIITATSTANSVFGNGTTGGVQIGDGTITKTTGTGFQFNSLINATGYQVGGTSGTSTTCTGGQYMSNQVVNGGIVTGGSCASAPATTLQAAYTASTGGTTPEIKLDSTRTALDIQDADATIGAGATLLAVRSSAAGALGTLQFGVTNTGNVTAAGTLTMQGAGSSSFVGNVGIGTTSPGAKLSIANGANDPSNYGQALQITNVSGNSQQVAFIRNGFNVVSAGYKGASSVWGFGTGQTTDSSFNPNYISLDGSSGNVGIGNSSPGGTRLQVNGTGTPASSGTTASGILRLQDSFNVATDFGTLGAAPWTSIIQAHDSTNQATNYPLALNPNGGSVGIGTTSPQAGLHVYGSSAAAAQVRVQNSLATSYAGMRLLNDQNNTSRALEIDYSGSTFSGPLVTNGPSGESGSITTTGALPLTLGTSNTMRLTVTSGGSVGIGTSSPAYLLSVAGTIAAGETTVSGNLVHTLIGYNTAGDYGTIDPVHENVAWTNLVLNSNGGSLGVGTSSIPYKLTVAGDIYANGGWVRVSGNDGLYMESWGGGWYMIDGTWMRSYQDKGVYTGGQMEAGSFMDLGTLYFNQTNPTIQASSYFIAPGGAYFNSGTVYAEAAIQARGGIHNDSGGNLVLSGGTSGTTETSSTLQVDGSANVYGGSVNMNNSSSDSINWSYSGGNAYITASSSFPGKLGFGGNGDPNWILGLDTVNHSVGVGDPTTKANLTIHGTSTTCTIGNGTSATNCSSDARLKKNVVSLTPSQELQGVLSLRPVDFQWIDPTKAPDVHMGFIAQEVQQIFPDMIHDTGDGYLGMDYANVVVPLVGAVQQQQSEITGINNQLSSFGAILNNGDIKANSLDVVSSAHFAADINVDGNLTVKGLTSVADIVVNGHIITGGQTPDIQILTAAGSSNASVSIDGNDTSGTITIVSGDASAPAHDGIAAITGPSAGDMATITFKKQYGKTPRILITPADGKSAPILVYPSRMSANSFTISLSNIPAANTTYTFNYFIVE